MYRNKNIIAVVGTLLVIGFMATSIISFLVSRSSLRTEMETSTLPLTSDNIYSEVQRDMFLPVFISSVMASDTFLRDWIISGEKQPYLIEKYLREIQKKHDTFTAFFVSEKTKTYYHSNGILKTVSEDEPRDKWYFRVREMKHDYEINVDPDMANRDAMTIFVNYRVYDYRGNYIGATGVGLTVSAVKKLVEEYQRKYNRSIIFVDDKGDVRLAGSGINQSLRNIYDKNNFPFFTRQSISENAFYRYKNRNQLILVNIRYIPQLDWFLIVEQAESNTDRQLITTLIINLGICLVITIIVVGLVSYTIARYKQRLETLRGIVPICSYCKQIRDDKGFWRQVEAYVAKHTEAEFSHGICPNCLENHFPEMEKD